ncbi:efflux transporter outer membrane subunit [Undibacterium jejuense]|uniref:Efflux transporter outer membrane subunit n=1 Tax=Undibacterium jejuense TaxID=1344949 RepID=A0A923HIW2_9BURK|nr:efflux transporter outer membrane subunit [Undibacterium jejuense]MBC3860526.1 efflux transporter outer membrane subunit [Undibacterium jejuense]
MKKNVTALSIIGVSWLMAACNAVGPNYSSPENHLPSSFSMTSNGTQELSTWWKSFGDADLNALVEHALANNPDIAAAEARLRQARALQGIQDAATGPTLEAAGRVSKDKLSQNSEQFANVPLKHPLLEFTNRQIGFDASWEIDLWGHQQRISESGLAKVQATAERLQDVRIVLMAEVGRNYIELRAAQQRFHIATSNLHNYEESLRLTQFAQRHGEASQLDVLKSQALRDNYLATLPTLQQMMRQNIVALSNLTTWPVEDLEQRLGTPKALMSVPQTPAIGIPADLLLRRPDIRAIERDLAAASADVGVAVSDLYPRFSLVGNAGWASIQSSSLLDAASRTWSIGPQFSLPIFNGRRLQNQVKSNQAAFDVASDNYKKSILNAIGDVEIALSRVSRNEESRRQLLTALDQQQQTLVKTQRQLALGEVSQFNVLETQKIIAVEQDQIVQTQMQSLSGLIALYKAVGGGWNQ